MVTVILQQMIDERISFLKEQINPENKPESRFCVKYKFVLSFDAFNEAIEEKERTAKEAEESKKRLEELEAKHEILQANTASVLNALMASEWESNHHR